MFADIVWEMSVDQTGGATIMSELVCGVGSVVFGLREIEYYA